MPKLLNFTVNTQFPMIAKTGTTKIHISQPSAYIPQDGEYYTRTVVNIGKGDIINCIISYNGKNYPVNTYRDIGTYFIELITVERTSSTQVTITMYVQDAYHSGGRTHNAWSADVTINTFSVP